jgi:short chain dehydrogenase
VDAGTFDRAFRINVRSAFLLVGAAAPVMAKRGSGRIINISSVSGQRGSARAAHASVGRGVRSPRRRGQLRGTWARVDALLREESRPLRPRNPCAGGSCHPRRTSCRDQGRRRRGAVSGERRGRLRARSRLERGLRARYLPREVVDARRTRPQRVNRGSRNREGLEYHVRAFFLPLFTELPRGLASQKHRRLYRV